MKKTRAKKFKVRIFYHLQNLFWGVFVQGGEFVGGFCQGFMSGRFLSWGRGVHLDFIKRLFSTSERYRMNVGRYHV